MFCILEKAAFSVDFINSYRLIIDFYHQSRTVFESDLISSSHLSGGSIAHAVEYLVEHFDLLLAQRILKGDTELVELVRELSGVNIALIRYYNDYSCR